MNDNVSIYKQFLALWIQFKSLLYEVFKKAKPIFLAVATGVLFLVEVFVNSMGWKIALSFIGITIVSIYAIHDYLQKSARNVIFSDSDVDAAIVIKKLQDKYNSRLESAIHEIEKAVVYLKIGDYNNSNLKIISAQNILLNTLITIADHCTSKPETEVDLASQPRLDAVLYVCCDSDIEGHRQLRPVIIGEVGHFPTINLSNQPRENSGRASPPPAKAFAKNLKNRNFNYSYSGDCTKYAMFRDNPRIKSMVSFPFYGEREGKTVVLGVVNLVTDQKSFFSKTDIDQICDFHSSILTTLALTITLYRSIKDIEIRNQI